MTPDDTKFRIGFLLVLLFWIAWVLGQVFRDANGLTSLFFYIPSGFLFVFLTGWGGYAWYRSRRRMAGLLALLALPPLLWVLCVENRLSARPLERPEGRSLRLIHWNVWGGRTGWKGIETLLKESEPDLCVLSEIPDDLDVPETAPSFGPDYQAVRISNMAVWARGVLADPERFRCKRGVKAWGVVWQSPQGNCRVLVVDLASSLFSPREPRLQVVRELMVDWKADLVVGDFNAPRRSRVLSSLPTGFTHAYEAAGSGCSYTWPMPCPLYAIDQCMLGPHVFPKTYTLESSWRSDHRRQVLEFSIEPESVEVPG
ncbi:MAG TPA: hypothetical protein PKH31_09185 [Candidatus Sumerlaeota bacterium]|nr:hypothetical protein [Candidatus Sumerlaeota bacterium]